MAKTVLSTTAARKKQQEAEWSKKQQATRNGGAQPLLNLNDLPNPARPVIYDIIATALPSPLVDNPVFNGIAGPYLTATFADEEGPVQLPLQMGYYGENLCASW